MRETLIFLSLAVVLMACKIEKHHSNRTKIESRKKFKTEWDERLNKWSDSTYQLTNSDIGVLAWGSIAFQLKSEKVERLFEQSHQKYDTLPTNLRYNLLLAMRALYPKSYNEFAFQKLKQETDPKINALLSFWYSEITDAKLGTGLIPNSKYSEVISKSNDALKIKNQDWHGIFSDSLFAGKKNIWMFLPKDRTIVGRALIQDSNGKLVKGVKEEIESFEYLGLSASSAPFYLTNGNTPAGIYSIQGTHKSSNIFIGPVPLIETYMPYEGKTDLFFEKEKVDSVWNIETYKQLIPEGLRNYDFMYQSYLAGKMGRSEIVIHGTTIDPEFFEGKSFYPLTPSLGCMCGKEIWSSKSGEIIESEHLRLLRTFKKLKCQPGLLVVIQVDVDTSEQLEYEIQNHLNNSNGEQ